MSLRKNLIALSLFNAATLLREQEEAAMPAPAAAPPPSPPAGAAPPSPESEPAGEAPTDEQGNPITLDKLIDRMNIIRSGLSFEDPEVYGKLTTFFKELPVEEKVQLHKQLSAVGAIVQSQNPQQEKGAAPGEPAPPEATPPAEASPPAAPAAPPPAV